MTAGFWRAACLEPVLPLLAETIASAIAAPRTRSAVAPTLPRRFRDTVDSFLPSIVPPFEPASARDVVDSTLSARCAVLDRPEKTAEEQGHPVSRDQHSDDDRGAEHDLLPCRREPEDQEH